MQCCFGVNEQLHRTLLFLKGIHLKIGCYDAIFVKISSNAFCNQNDRIKACFRLMNVAVLPISFLQHYTIIQMNTLFNY